MSNVRLWKENWDQPFHLDGRVVDPSSRRIRIDGDSVEIEPRVMAVLIALAERAGETVRRQELIDRVWSGAPGADQSLNNAISLLRRALKDSDTGKRLITTVPKQGYQLCASVQFQDGQPKTLPDEPSPVQAAPSNDMGRYRFRTVIAALGIVAFLAAAVFVLQIRPSSQQQASTTTAAGATLPVDPLSIAVLPFENFSMDTENAYFADGLAEEILHALSQIETLKVASRTDSFQFRASETPIAEIAQRLGVANVLEGSVRRSDDMLRVTVQLISAENNAHLWSSTYDRRAEDILAIQQDIAVNIANALVEEMSGSERTLLTTMPTASFEAYENYLIGKYEMRKWTPDGNRRAVDALERAVSFDPEFAEARLALGKAYYFAGTHYGWMNPSEAIPKVKASLVYGVSAPNPVTRAAALSIYADVLAWSDKDWNGAIAAYQRSYELSGTPALGYGLTNSIIGEHDAAIEIFRMLLDGGPDEMNINDDVGIRNNLAWAYFNARRYEEAQRTANTVISADDAFADGYRVLGRAQLQLGLHDEAVKTFSIAAKLMNNAPIARSDLAVALARTGRSDDAKNILRELENTDEYVPAPLVAQIYANLGDADAAFLWIEKGIEDSARGVVFLKINPLYDPIRSDPRFSAILTRLNLSS